VTDPNEVKYDFGAADELHWALTMLAAKLEDFANLRANERAAYLTTGDDHTAWKGQKHDLFEDRFKALQATFASFHDRALTLKGLVDQATIEASDASGRQVATVHGAS